MGEKGLSIKMRNVSFYRTLYLIIFINIYFDDILFSICNIKGIVDLYLETKLYDIQLRYSFSNVDVAKFYSPY
jgi:hypothetical protein